jgi:hypothetical protein
MTAISKYADELDAIAAQTRSGSGAAAGGCTTSRLVQFESQARPGCELQAAGPLP